jgi:G:T-mismatch repair DNA endonuclease (very short patch repair protein)
MQFKLTANEIKNKKFNKTCSPLCKHEAMSMGARQSILLQGDSRRSKNEIYFSELCKSTFSNVETNIGKFNGWDADVILNDHKIAILWNGKWHYEQISKSRSLKQIQNRDNIKLSEIEKFGYKSYIIKDMGGENKKFVEEKFRELVNWLSQVSHKD